MGLIFDILLLVIDTIALAVIYYSFWFAAGMTGSGDKSPFIILGAYGLALLVFFILGRFKRIFNKIFYILNLVPVALIVLWILFWIGAVIGNLLGFWGPKP